MASWLGHPGESGILVQQVQDAQAEKEKVALGILNGLFQPDYKTVPIRVWAEMEALEDDLLCAPEKLIGGRNRLKLLRIREYFRCHTT